MYIKDLYPGCTYHHDNTWSVLNDDMNEGFDFILDPMDFYHIYQSTLFPEQLAPILLTREILSKVGLIQTQDEIWFSRKANPSPHIHSKQDRFGVWSFDCGVQYFADRGVLKVTKPLKHLHELQLIFKVAGVNLHLGTEKNFDDASQT